MMETHTSVFFLMVNLSQLSHLTPLP